MTATAVRPSETPPSSGRRRLAGGVVGTFVEWYDFQIYGLSAPILALHFFPGTNPTAALLGTFAIYAIAFFIRPLGGVFFGYLGDRHGRINILAATILLMGGATVLTGLLPTYESIGILAAVLLLLCRLAQGFSAGGETSGGLSYILESAPEGKRAQWVTIGVASSFLPSVVGGLLILGLRSGLGEQAYTNWAWRIPFLLGGVLALVGLWLRRKLDDPEEYTEAAASDGVAKNPVRSAARGHLKAMILVIFLVAVQAVGAYILNGYMFTYLTTTIGMESVPALATNATAVMSIVILMPVFGMLADRIGRKRLMLAGAVWFAVVAYPALQLAGTATTLGALAGQLLLAIGVALFGAGGFVTLLELFPTTLRFTGHAISYNLGYAIFGGTTPLIAAALVGGFGSAMAPGFYMIAVAVIGIIVVAATPETRDVLLRTARSDETGAAPEPLSEVTR
jgi:MHS family proline/betaine transporter-like MFS transporter